jgi:hypothetical protein
MTKDITHSLILYNYWYQKENGDTTTNKLLPPVLEWFSPDNINCREGNGWKRKAQGIGRQVEKILKEAYSDLKVFKALENPC